MIVDASVAVKILVREEDTVKARALVAYGPIAAPDLLLVETANAMWSKIRRGDLALGDIDLSALPTLFPDLVPAADLFEQAFELALELRHPVYDCLYLALAIQRGDRVVTADRRFLDVVRASGHSQHVVALADWQG